MFLTKNNGIIIGPIASLLGWLMNGIFTVLNKVGIPNVGLAIIIMTIIIYMCMLPLTIRQQKFSKLQRVMQPELNKINKKYEGRKDSASMEKQQQETQAVYKKYGVSATGSCVQLLIQMPILLALYRVFYNIPAYITIVKDSFFPLVDELIKVDPQGEYLQTFSVAKQFAKQFTNENFVSGSVTYVQNTFIDVLNKFSSADWMSLSGKFTDLQSHIDATVSKLTLYNNFLGLNIANSPSYTFKTSLADKHYGLIIGAILIPLLAAATNYLSIKLTPQVTDGNDQMSSTMRSMNITMPLMSAVFCWTLPAGMGIYWIAGAVVRTIQMIIINKQIDKMDIDEMIAKNTEKQKKKEEKSNKRDKNHVEGNTVSTYSNMNTRNIKSDQNDKYSTKISKEQEEELEKVRQSNSGKKYRKGSLAEKVNMVDAYNDSRK